MSKQQKTPDVTEIPGPGGKWTAKRSDVGGVDLRKPDGTYVSTYTDSRAAGRRVEREQGR